MSYHPGFTWSHTLSSDLDTCVRRVYYRVYGSWGGWGFRSENPESRPLYQIKQSKTLPMYVGVLLHEVIKKILERCRVGGVLADEPKMKDRIQQRMREEIAYSKAGSWKTLNNPKQATLILHPHLVGSDIADHEIEESIEKAQNCLSAFLSTWLPDLLSVGTENWLLIDSLDKIQHGEYALFVAPDFVYRMDKEPNAPIRLLDWKTGKTPDIEQLEIYGLHLQGWFRRHGLEIPTQQMQGFSIPLLCTQDTGHLVFSQEHLDHALARIEADLARLRPLEEPGVHRDKTVFPRTEHRGRCSGCLYHSFCEMDEE
jgi:hypothetical protein